MVKRKKKNNWSMMDWEKKKPKYSKVTKRIKEELSEQKRIEKRAEKKKSEKLGKYVEQRIKTQDKLIRSQNIDRRVETAQRVASMMVSFGDKTVFGQKHLGTPTAKVRKVNPIKFITRGL